MPIPNSISVKDKISILIQQLRPVSCKLIYAPLVSEQTSPINSLVLGRDVSHDVLVEKLEDQRNAVGEDQVLRHKLELVDMIDLEEE